MMGGNKSKRGILLPETLKIIIAVLSIILLMILAVKLFNLFTSKTEIEQAKAALEQITNIIEDLDEGETAEYLVTGPGSKPNSTTGWYLVSYNRDEANIKNTFNIPSKCTENSCLCICKETVPEKNLQLQFIIPPIQTRLAKDILVRDIIRYYFYLDALIGDLDGGLENCEKTGICKNFESKNIYVDNTVEYKIGKEEKSSTNLVRWISFYDSPKNIYIKKYKQGENEEIIITTNKPKKAESDEATDETNNQNENQDNQKEQSLSEIQIINNIIYYKNQITRYYVERGTIKEVHCEGKEDPSVSTILSSNDEAKTSHLHKTIGQENQFEKLNKAVAVEYGDDIVIRESYEEANGYIIPKGNPIGIFDLSKYNDYYGTTIYLYDKNLHETKSCFYIIKPDYQENDNYDIHMTAYQKNIKVGKMEKTDSGMWTFSISDFHKELLEKIGNARLIIDGQGNGFIE